VRLPQGEALLSRQAVDAALDVEDGVTSRFAQNRPLTAFQAALAFQSDYARGFWNGFAQV